MRRLALPFRLRCLGCVIDIVMPDPIVGCQVAVDASVPPERTALDGRRSLDGKNLRSRRPSGLDEVRG